MTNEEMTNEEMKQIQLIMEDIVNKDSTNQMLEWFQNKYGTEKYSKLKDIRFIDREDILNWYYNIM